MTELLTDGPILGDQPFDGTPEPPPARPQAQPRPGRKPSSSTAPKAPRKRTTRPAAPGKSKATGPDYRAVIKGVIDIPTVALAVAAPGNPVLQADAITLQMHSDSVAEALATLAAERPEFAALLDRLMTVGPYSAIFAALIPLGLQLAVNHGLLAAGIGGTADLVGRVPQPRSEQPATPDDAAHQG